MEPAANTVLQTAQKALALQDVFLRMSHCSVEDVYIPSDTDASAIQVQTRIQTSAHRVIEQCSSEGTDTLPARCIEYKVVTGARFTQESSDSADEPKTKKCGEVVAVFAVVYQMRENLKEEALMEFGIRNAAFHVWPYWREFLHSATGRLRLPGVVLPMYRQPMPTESKDIGLNDKAPAPQAVADHQKVDLTDRYDLAHLMTLFWISEDELRAAAASVQNDRNALLHVLSERFSTIKNRREATSAPQIAQDSK